MSAASRIAVFAYGSLVDPASAALTLGRPVPGSSPASLPGWRRRWSVVRDNLGCEKTFARASDGTKPRWILGLNIEQVAREGNAAALNGALIEVSESELERPSFAIAAWTSAG
jgi:hypothetical protein